MFSALWWATGCGATSAEKLCERMAQCAEEESIGFDQAECSSDLNAAVQAETFTIDLVTQCRRCQEDNACGADVSVDCEADCGSIWDYVAASMPSSLTAAGGAMNVEKADVGDLCDHLSDCAEEEELEFDESECSSDLSKALEIGTFTAERVSECQACQEVNACGVDVAMDCSTECSALWVFIAGSMPSAANNLGGAHAGEGGAGN